jgi:hypothetical protein
MEAPAQRQRMTTRDLYERVKRYIDDNEHSNDVNVRWLCTTLEPILLRIGHIMNDRAPEGDKQAIAAFRSAEIEAEIANRRKDIERLERDLQKVKAA